MVLQGDEYNPLDYANLTRNCVQELMRRPAAPMPPPENFSGAGVYALFYQGDSAFYRKVRSPNSDWPIYVGKAVPPGARKGGKQKGAANPLCSRLRQHATSIDAAASTLRISDFRCRYLVVTPLWITMAERFLIEHYQPVWNVNIEGFGNHDPGKGRHEGEITWWDALHPGREWAARLQQTKTPEHARQRLAAFLAAYELRPREVSFEKLREAETGSPEE